MYNIVFFWMKFWFETSSQRNPVSIVVEAFHVLKTHCEVCWQNVLLIYFFCLHHGLAKSWVAFRPALLLMALGAVINWFATQAAKHAHFAFVTIITLTIVKILPSCLQLHLNPLSTFLKCLHSDACFCFQSVTVMRSSMMRSHSASSGPGHCGTSINTENDDSCHKIFTLCSALLTLFVHCFDMMFTLHFHSNYTKKYAFAHFYLTRYLRCVSNSSTQCLHNQTNSKTQVLLLWAFEKCSCSLHSETVLRHFVCPLTGAHTNNVERSWKPLKE